MQQIRFAVVSGQNVKDMLDAEARGDREASRRLAEQLPEDAWGYLIALHGTGPRYAKERILIVVGHDALEVSSGYVVLTRESQQIEIQLRVKKDGEEQDFQGNGVFKFSTVPR